MVLGDTSQGLQGFGHGHSVELPQLIRFPLPVQKLIVEELDALRHMRDDDSDRIDEDNVQCDCLFFRKYYLPCRHILLADRTYEILTEDHWNNFGVMFENRGFDVYEGRGQEPAREGDRGEMGSRSACTNA
ncbi:hypothetical protein V1517DRAFT_332998 [Lipomyces orientalis]|uniref:Uncharacterized protein n=1 Tax=Lipomyces orientalis TaxID=1233043 RepID=A0ACC3TEL0_9ASCO